MKKVISNHILYCLLLIAYCLSLLSCNPTKKLSEGELLLKKNVVYDKSSGIDKSEIESYIKQKPNRKMLFWRFYLNIYNSVNREKLEKRKGKRNIRIDSVNAKRIRENDLKSSQLKAVGKKQDKVSLKSKERLTRREWLISIGEPPVIYDSLLAHKSVKQIKLFLNNKGYFNNVVKDSVKIKRKKAVVYYIVHSGQPYRVRNLKYEIKDSALSRFVHSKELNALIKHGEKYDLDILDKERDRITSLLRNEGYFYFAKDYIYFEVDSFLGSHEVDITLGIKNPMMKIPEPKDSIAESTHKRYYLNNIYIQTDYDSKRNLTPTDTLLVNDYYLLSTGKLIYKPRLITDAVFLVKGDLFQQVNYESTYKRLSELKLFRSVQLQFSDIGNSHLDCSVYLSNIPKQSFSIEPQYINTSSTQGIEGNVIYQNKNSFKGGEIVEVKLKGAIEVQKSLSGQEKNVLTNTKSDIPFNTLEFGGQVNLYVPRFLTPFGIQGRKSNNAKTNFTSIYNYQKRPDFGRSISNVAFGYSWNETPTKTHIINPIEFSLVNIFNVSSSLQSTIDNSKDLFLKNSYSDHFTIGTRYAFIFSNQNIRKQQNFSYLRIGVEGAGNGLRGAFNFVDHYIEKLPFQNNSYLIDSIPFSQFVRADIDYRYYKIVNRADKVVFRAAVGWGTPLQNLSVLPLEKSFFSGGPNGIRAWQARTLGPGGYQESTANAAADKIGDIKIEGNLEYRFHVIKLINAALFVDAGNVWLGKKYASYPLGEFDTQAFFGQIALGAGLGLRLDFNFFIIRLDGAIKIKDPSLPEGERWTLNKQPFKRSPILNFGIGYPF
ncbi:MAG: BamA/TamA family outer membrane protein [Bacteroidetes bacterium]|nr:BamA/TamA family outer membrane protein [Bacteroidota bacterium]